MEKKKSSLNFFKRINIRSTAVVSFLVLIIIIFYNHLVQIKIETYWGFILIPLFISILHLYILKKSKSKKDKLRKQVSLYISISFMILLFDAIIVIYYFQNNMVSMLIGYSLGLYIVARILYFILEIIKKYQNDTNELFNGLREQFDKNREISEQLSVMVEELSASIEEISSSSENIASSQQQISKGASNQVVAINQIQNDIQNLSADAKRTQEKILEIGMLSEMIEKISKETNMLALNAAIEAARAGEAGRGFNVVAEQVRKLADESRNAVKEANNMLQDIKSISEMQQQTMMKIIDSIDLIATVSEETSASTEEAASSAEEQSSSMESISSTSQTLMNLAESLNKENIKFQNKFKAAHINTNQNPEITNDDELKNRKSGKLRRFKKKKKEN